jgi:hypothetical protein
MHWNNKIFEEVVMKQLSFKLNDHEEELWNFYITKELERDIRFKSNKDVLIKLLSQYKMRHLKEWREYSGKHI